MHIMQTRLFFKKYTTEEGEDESLHVISTAIKTRQWPHGLNIEKMHVPGFTILSARLNEKQRVLFTLLPPSAEGEKTLLFLDYLPDHGYQRSLFLNPVYLRNFFSTQRLVEAQPVDVASDTLNADDAIFTELGIDLEAGSHEGTESFTIETYTRPTISLSDEQREALSLTLPAVIKGVPGSGKTSVLEMILQQHETEEKMLYITKSPQLAAAAKFVVEDLGLTEKITVMTVDELYEQHGRSRLNLATARQHALNSAQNMFHRSKLTPETLVKEFPLLAVLESKERYLKLGQRQTALQGTKREIVSSCYAHFQREHPDEAALLYNPLVIQPQERWNLIAVDEAQDLDIKTLIDLFNLADNGGIVYSYDPNQNISDNLSSQIDNLTLLRSLIHEKQGLTLSEHVLSKTYRCPPAIAAQASLVRAVIGHIVEQHRWDSKAMLSHIESAQTEESAPVCWIDYHSKDNTRFNAAKALLNDSVQWAVITIEDQKEEARQLFNTSLVFSIDEIKGLEYKHIIMFNMMKDEAYAQIASFLTNSRPNKKELTESTLHQKMNCLFTAMTRSMESLWIIEEQSHKKVDLFKALGQEQGRLETVSLDIRESTLEEWLHEVNRLIDAGHDEKAKCIYQQQCGIKSRDHCEWVPFEDYRQAYDSRQDYKSLKKDDTPDEHRQYAQEPGRVLCFSSGKAMVSEKSSCTENDHKSTQNLAAEKKILTKILKKNWSKEILEETLIDRESFFRLLTNLDPTSRDKDQPFISRLLKKKEDRGALSNFVSFCEENQNRVHCELFTCMIDEHSALHYLANFDLGRKLIAIFFNELKLEEYLAQDARSHAAILNFLGHIEENDRENILGVVRQKVKDLQNILNPELYKKIKGQKKILFQHVKITKLISTASAIVKTLLSKREIRSSSTSLPETHSCKEKSLSAMKDALPLHLENSLYEAVKKNNLTETHSLINSGFTMEPALDGETPLHLAAKRKYLNIAQALIQKYSGNIDDKTDKGWTALHYAVFNQHEDLVTLLITAKADLNAINLAGATALHLASQNNDLRMVSLLLQAGASMRTSDHGETPLHLAVAYGYLPITQALIQQYPESVNQQNNEGYTALHCAVSENKEEVTRYLLEAGSDLNLKTSCGDTSLHLAAGSGHLSIARALIEQYPGSINDQNNKGWTALHCAVSENKEEVTHYLLEAGSDLNLKISCGDTSLHLAAGFGHLSIARALIEKYPRSINEQNNEGWTALHCAVSENKEEVTHYLLEAGSNFNLKTSCGKTPLHLAAGSGHLSITRALIEQYPGSINDQNNEGWTALHCAVLENKKDVICYLLEARSDCNLKTHRGKTPREIAVQLEFLEIIELFDQLSIDNQSKGSLNFSAVKRFC